MRLAALDANLPVRPGPQARLLVTLQGPHGPIALG